MSEFLRYNMYPILRIVNSTLLTASGGTQGADLDFTWFSHIYLEHL